MVIIAPMAVAIDIAVEPEHAAIEKEWQNRSAARQSATHGRTSPLGRAGSDAGSIRPFGAGFAHAGAAKVKCGSTQSLSGPPMGCPRAPSLPLYQLRAQSWPDHALSKNSEPLPSQQAGTSPTGSRVRQPSSAHSRCSWLLRSFRSARQCA